MNFGKLKNLLEKDFIDFDDNCMSFGKKGFFF